MRRSRSTVSAVVAMFCITAKRLAAHGYPRAPEAATTLEGGPGGGSGTVFKLTGLSLEF
jgi:hypothetical protein